MSIQLNNVRFAYSGASEASVLNIRHWSVGEGEQVFVHGPSGGGKSTLLNVLNGLFAVTEGEVSVLGQRLDQLNSRQRDGFRANHIGCIFQQFNLVPYLDAIDNIRLARRFSGKPLHAALPDEISVLLTAFHIARADWNKPVAKLSVGQQQRIAIARAMINRPELLIADEPTSSLDHDNRDNFMAELMSWVEHHNMTLVFVSHDLSLATYFNRVNDMSEINTPAGDD